MLKKQALCFLFTLMSLALIAQETGSIYGTVTDEFGKALELVNVALEGETIGISTDAKGNYELTGVSPNRTYKLVATYIGYESQSINVNLKQNQRIRRDFSLKQTSVTTEKVIVTAEDTRTQTGLMKIPSKVLVNIPAVSELAILKTLPGVVSNSELSNSYSVRGGNYDENLIYVNDFEVYRPFLIRTGQQEGLSFINPDMIQSLEFSSGGFEAKYGDKLSSVLDIKYKKPWDFGGSVTLSLLGVNAHVGGSSKNKRFTYNLGIRNKNNKYFFRSLPVEGEYSPSAWDLQGFFTYQLNTNWHLQYMTNYSQNRFLYYPTVSETSFGTFNQSLKLQVYFDGQERDRYQTLMNGIGGTFLSDDKRLSLKFRGSAFVTEEREAFDIIGEYWIGEVETDFSSDDFGERKRTLGVGTYHDWARNELEALITNVEHRGVLDKGEHVLTWGAKFQNEQINDKINEWYRVDSAGFSKPYSTEEVLLREVLKANLELNSNRISGFVQDNWSVDDSNRLKINAGMRFNYWDVNKVFFVTPRAQLSYRSNWKPGNFNPLKELVFRAAAGTYYQPPFYRELRNSEGELNLDLKPQKSAHLVGGVDYTFPMWDRPFKFSTDVYYKFLWDLVTYDLDNVLIRYSGLNNAKGYATGIDMRLNGEFIEGSESWFSVSFMQTKEDLNNDSYYRYLNSDGEPIITGETENTEITDSTLVSPGLIFRPTDQRINLGIFFQDHLPNNENFKMHLSVLFGTGFSFGPPGKPRYRNLFRLPAYRRVDIGFSALLFDAKKMEAMRPNNPFKVFNRIWASLEVFNLLGVDNTISYTWVDAFNGLTYGVPNHLTSRRVNFKIQFGF